MKKTDRVGFLKNPTSIMLVIMGIAIFLRIWNLSEWSLWEDEEASLFYSQNLDMPFPSFFPLFFTLLNGIFRMTGVSIDVGRLVAAVFGILSIWFVYLCFRRLLSPGVALFAAFLLAINFGHIFWSQSIRYYSALFCFQLLSLYFFIHGFEKGELKELFLSNIFLFLATMIHSSAILIVPGYILYLAIMIIKKESVGGYSLRNYPIYILFLLFGVGFFLWKSVIVHGTMSAIVIPSAMDPVHILITVIAYFGAPILVLRAVAPFFASSASRRILVFLFIMSVLPIAEIIVISRGTSVTWYHAFIAMSGFTLLASYTIISVYTGGRRKLGVLIGVACVGYYIVFLAPYYITSHGARPQWENACRFLQDAAHVNIGSNNNPEIFATAPGVVAHYLGVKPDETMGHPLVKRLLFRPPDEPQVSDRWILIKSNYMTEEYNAWFRNSCTMEARFDSKIGSYDRWSILIYHCPLTDSDKGP